jgi:glycosyltransferase involved in cell wall biosynthesis
MKVLMLTPSFPPIIGGTERLVQNLTLKLNQIGIHTDVMTFNMSEKWNPVWREEVKEDGFKVFRVPALNIFRKLSYNPLEISLGAHVIPKLSFVKRLKEYDILHFHDDVDLSFSIFSWFVNKPKIFQCHTLTATHPQYKRNCLPRKILNKVGNSYICVSNWAKKLLLDLGVPESKIFILRNGVDVKKFKPKEAERIDNLVLFAGRIIRPKGLHVLLDSLGYVDIPIHLRIAGPKQDCKYAEMLGSNGKQERGIHKVEWLGRIQQDKIMELYQKASVFANPALSDDFGIVNLEAAACETPIIASEVGGIKEFVKNGVNGILVPPNDPKKLANAIKKLLGNRKLREEYGKNGRKMVEDHFSWESVAKEAVRIYEEVIKSEQMKR